MCVSDGKHDMHQTLKFQRSEPLLGYLDHDIRLIKLSGVEIRLINTLTKSHYVWLIINYPVTPLEREKDIMMGSYGTFCICAS